MHTINLNMHQTIFVCVGDVDEEPCGWMGTEDNVPKIARYYLHCPKCKNLVNDGKIQEDESIDEAAQRERNTAWE